ncbi:MAG: hypothetical protein QGF53_04530 [Alphaproteobacteria bacterium]|jgi:hypothetical protein|nr:hypothetical protein [Alphaproteobacteria bacterium]
MSSQQRRHFLFTFGLAMLVSHELDAIVVAEWRLLPLLNLLPDETAHMVFLALHVPVLAGLFWLTAFSSPRCRYRSQLVFDAFLIGHAGVHGLMSGHTLYMFDSWLSHTLIYGAAIVGTVHLILAWRAGQTPAGV